MVALFLLPGASRAQEVDAGEKLVGGEIELTRTVSSHLFAVQRAEREAAAASPIPALVRDVRSLAETLETELAVSVSSGPVPDGQAPAEGAKTRLARRAERVQALRAERGERMRRRLARVRQRCDELEAQMASLSSERQRTVTAQAVRKARHLGEEIESAWALPASERRVRLGALRTRLDQLADRAVRATDLPSTGTPTFRSITRHRKLQAASR
jgi:hypothetical protein